MSGWVKLHRQFESWEWYDDINVKVLFIHLLLKANHKSSNYRGHTIEPGSLVTGRIALASQLGLSEQQIRTALDKLKSTREITIKKTNKFSVISVSCWGKFQGDNQQITNNQPTSNQQVTTSKEGKNVKNGRKEEESALKKVIENSDLTGPTKTLARQVVTHCFKNGGEAESIEQLIRDRIAGSNSEFEGTVNRMRGN